MRLRGKILRELSADPGLAMMEGRQYRFSAAEWRSATKPVAGMEVEAVLDDSHRIMEIALASEELAVRQLSVLGSFARILHWLIEKGGSDSEQRLFSKTGFLDCTKKGR